MSDEKVAENTVVSVHYTGSFPDDDEVFDTSREGDPMTFLIGHKNMIPGFEAGVIGAAVGDEVEFTLEPADAYGDMEEGRVVSTPRDQFPEEMPLELGLQLVADIGGQPTPFTIIGFSDVEVKCDFNHPMAGKTLHFKVEIVDLRDATEDEIAHGHAHGPDGHHHDH
jgi:FKBP-type peptidyl-prolyl cis-trans isomerase SlyD